MSASPAYVLCADLETAGTDETIHPILEVGWILCRWDGLEQIDEGTIPISPDLDGPSRWLAWRESMEPFVVQMHTNNGLLAEIATNGQAIGDADSWLSAYLRNLRRSGLVALAGSGVGHFDRRFINAQMPRTAKRLTYWSLDVGVIRRVAQLAGRDDLGLALPEGGKPHRALDDARLHLAELRHWIGVLGGMEVAA